MSRLSRNLVTIYRTERLIARRRLAVVQQQTILFGIAGIAALLALVLLNLALFFALQSTMSPASASAVLALGNLGFAGLLVLIARRSSVEDEVAPAVEVRDMAIADIEDELEEVATEAREVVQAVKSIGSNPLGSATTVLVPLISMLIKSRSNE
ncbi:MULTISPECIES: hypothetical protein [unclassified Ruegeria]|uniref:hypothetical protein n=1 Tax=unclassified Ruegeria TaxID=2625375 RepID=UPI001488DEE3|nr:MULTISPECIES: hypothetical protein [unclassified Ruegeria]NOD46516.1 hypothetical protein [Ruegeria sp. HKCCD5849]NOD50184.1 hypothetical protein [Ruegeria sp. HKCCD5851]NOD67019.1 hypothetical protein [Ruegeria sp. HKCCD7303]NOE32608.1 hypothetical protein [Ruegeria sp. HKCCD7318]